MSNVLSWVWDMVSGTSSTSSLTIVMGVALALSLFANRTLSTDLTNERFENAQLLQQMTAYKESLTHLESLRNADQKVAQRILTLEDKAHTINIQTALDIAGVPSLIERQIDEQSHKQSNNTYEQKHEHEHEHEQKHEQKASQKGSRKAYSIDVPLRELSYPLVMLHKKLSSDTNGTASTVAHEDKPITRSASKHHDSKATSSVGKSASY